MLKYVFYCSVNGSNITVTGQPRVLLCNNVAMLNGAAIYCNAQNQVVISKNSIVFMHNNKAMQHGGGICLDINSAALFEGQSCTIF